MRKKDKIVDQGRVYAAGLLNKYYNMLIHLEDLVYYHDFSAPGLGRDINGFSGNIWAALAAIVKGHANFEPHQTHGMSASLSVSVAPMETLAVLVLEEKVKFTSLVTSAGEFVKGKKYALLNLLDVSPLLKLIQEIPELQKIYKVPQNGPEYKKVSAQQIPSFLKFKSDFQEDHNKGPLGFGILQTGGLFGKKGLGLIKSLRSTTMSRKLETWGDCFTIDQVIRHAQEQKDPNSRTKEILKKLGVQYAPTTRNQISHLLEEQNFLITVLRPIILDYLSGNNDDYIRIINDNSEKYLDNTEISSLNFGR